MRTSSHAHISHKVMRGCRLSRKAQAEKQGKTQGWRTAYVCVLSVFPLIGACCAQIKGFTLGCREQVLVRHNVKPFI